MPAEKIKWGIIGCGRIARKFAADLCRLEEGVLYAIASRSAQNAHAFVQQFPAKYVYTSYEDLVKNPAVDIVYIATPHSLHYDHTRLCLRHGKAVLCEKAFAENAQQAAAMIKEARERKLFLMEAMWTRFLPHFVKMQEMIRADMIGEVKYMHNRFCYVPAATSSPRLWKKELGGGCLLDIGVYTIFMALQVLGKPDQVEASFTLTSAGVESQCAMYFSYANGAMVQNVASYETALPVEAFIVGTKGCIKLPHRFHAPLDYLEYFTENQSRKEIIPVKLSGGFGLQYEITHAMQCLRDGKLESDQMTHADTMLQMEILDEVRACALKNYRSSK